MCVYIYIYIRMPILLEQDLSISDQAPVIESICLADKKLPSTLRAVTRLFAEHTTARPDMNYVLKTTRCNLRRPEPA